MFAELSTAVEAVPFCLRHNLRIIDFGILINIMKGLSLYKECINFVFYDNDEN